MYNLGSTFSGVLFRGYIFFQQNVPSKKYSRATLGNVETTLDNVGGGTFWGVLFQKNLSWKKYSRANFFNVGREYFFPLFSMVIIQSKLLLLKSWKFGQFEMLKKYPRKKKYMSSSFIMLRKYSWLAKGYVILFHKVTKPMWYRYRRGAFTMLHKNVRGSIPTRSQS